MSMQRRTFLSATLAAGAVGAAVGTGLLTPRTVWAAWPKAAFESKNVQDTLKNLTGSDASSPSDSIKIKAPDIAENGAVVPVTVSSSLSDIESISIITEKNPLPLAATFTLGSGAMGFVSTRIKMGKTSNLIAVVKAGGKLYSARKEVKVTIGGCGG